jgi:hypothetical protein
VPRSIEEWVESLKKGTEPPGEAVQALQQAGADVTSLLTDALHVAEGENVSGS